MYSTCLFCNGQLGSNEAIEHFPVGRRLAFDGAKGRLWVVCRKCERWNLTPLEERWEAIEECERAFCETRLRVSTDHVGLARLREGTELVRIGEPQRPEMAAWRYGDQFGRRRRKRYALVAGGIAAVGAVAVTGSVLGVLGIGAINPAVNLFNLGRGLYQHRTLVHVPGVDGLKLPLRLRELPKVKFEREGDEIVLTVKAIDRTGGVPWWRFSGDGAEVQLRGMQAVRATGALLPRLNNAGGSRAQVQRAVDQLTQTPDLLQLFAGAAGPLSWRPTSGFRTMERITRLGTLPHATRLALEMASHEDAERRALEGELHMLEAAWRDAEEVAGIADDMFLPESVMTGLERLKRSRDGS